MCEFATMGGIELSCPGGATGMDLSAGSALTGKIDGKNDPQMKMPSPATGKGIGRKN